MSGLKPIEMSSLATWQGGYFDELGRRPGRDEPARAGSAADFARRQGGEVFAGQSGSVAQIDDAMSLVLARFYPADTTEAHMDLLGRWLKSYGQPRGLYTDRHGIFEAHK